MSWRRKPRKRVLKPRNPDYTMQVTMNVEEMRAGPNEPPDTAVAQTKVPLRASDEPPMMIERMKKHEQGHDEGASPPTLSYEEANWARLSPVYRAAHNRLRQARGISPLPPPAVDLYVAPRPSVIRPLDIEAELRSAVRAQATGLLGGGLEGFERR